MVTLKAHERQTTFWKCKDWRYFVIIHYRIALLKLGSKKKNYIK